MNHQPYENWLLDKKSLTPAEKERLAQHLAVCPQCAQFEHSLHFLEHEIKAMQPISAPEGFCARWQSSLPERRKKHEREQSRIIIISMASTTAAVCMTLAAFLLPQISPITVMANLLSGMVKLVNSISQFWSFVTSFLEAAPTSLSIGIALTVSIWLSLTLLAWGISLYRITSKGIRAVS
jgi:hypothetical protein